MLLLATPAFGQCEKPWRDYEYVNKHLKDAYDEDRIGVGLSGPTQMGHNLIAEFYSSGRTWSVVLTRGDGCSIVVLAGKDWEKLEVKRGYGL